MKYLLFVLFSAAAFAYSNPNDDILENIDPSKYYAAEYQDGVGAEWDGTDLVGRKYSYFHIPSYFTKGWPQFAMHGVLSCDTDYYDALRDVNSGKLECVQFYVYELPGQKGDIHSRLEPLRKWIKEHPGSNLHIIEQYEFKNRSDLEKFFNQAVDEGREGIVLASKGSKYSQDKHTFLTIRKFFKDLCTITKVNLNSKGELENYECSWQTIMGYRAAKKPREREQLSFLGLSTQIVVASGFSEEHKKHPLAVGTQIGFRYTMLDDSGRPSRPYFLRDF